MQIVTRQQFGLIASYWSGGTTTISHSTRRTWAGRTGRNLAHWLGREVERELQADELAALNGPYCVACGKQKDAGHYTCASCFDADMRAESTDWEEVERIECLLRVLPDGIYTASEMREYLA